jgi:DNA modification methylase
MDPPYGIEVFGGNMSGRKAHDTYSDEADVYWRILGCLCDNLDTLMTPSSHFMLWFSMEHYSKTLEFFRERAPSLDFSPFPLIWTKSDNVGILPDPKRGPRRIYETALIATRSDHLIVRPVSNSYAAPTDKTYHPSTKPEPMLRYFFQMFVDESTRLLDPTCGSGSALRAAESLGAKEVLGLERDPKHFEAANIALRSFRNLRRATGV